MPYYSLGYYAGQQADIFADMLDGMAPYVLICLMGVCTICADNMLDDMLPYVLIICWVICCCSDIMQRQHLREYFVSNKAYVSTFWITLSRHFWTHIDIGCICIKTFLNRVWSYNHGRQNINSTSASNWWRGMLILETLIRLGIQIAPERGSNVLANASSGSAIAISVPFMHINPFRDILILNFCALVLSETRYFCTFNLLYCVRLCNGMRNEWLRVRNMCLTHHETWIRSSVRLRGFCLTAVN